ncbi:MAG: DUF4406 domain-containing protein [Candidatus Odinarchaeota archaeon]
MKRIYIAGALNSDACGYIKNLHKMIIYAEKVRKEEFSVFIPGIDFLAGVVIGTYNYNDYFDNSQPWMECADALFLVPGWIKSKGTKKEILKAKELNIPIFCRIKDLVKYYNNGKAKEK